MTNMPNNLLYALLPILILLSVSLTWNSSQIYHHWLSTYGLPIGLLLSPAICLWKSNLPHLQQVLLIPDSCETEGRVWGWRVQRQIIEKNIVNPIDVNVYKFPHSCCRVLQIAYISLGSTLKFCNWWPLKKTELYPLWCSCHFVCHYSWIQAYYFRRSFLMLEVWYVHWSFWYF
jgi:hypothetical protein